MRRWLISAASMLLCACGPTGGSGGQDAGVDSDAVGEADAGPDCPSTCEVIFRYPRQDGISTVELRGDFDRNGWNEGVPMIIGSSEFETRLSLEDGRWVNYKFLLNGSDWVDDPANPGTGPDNNSVIQVDCGCSSARFDWRDGIMYFVFLDRFKDGDGGNNQPIEGVDPAANYQGGDLAGLLEVIESGYFEGLGVNTLWITSPIDNADQAWGGADGRSYTGYHGYWPKDLDAVESRFGTDADLQAVVDAAHDRGIKIILDYAMNHVHSESPTYVDHPEWFWPNDNGSGGNCVCGDGCGWEGYDGRRCWFRDYLPDFDFTNSEARAYSIENALKWAVETGVDGFRLDAVKHIETAWLTDLREELRAEVEAKSGELFYLVGETYTGDKGLIASYVDPATKLDGQFDFPLRAEITRVILRRQGTMGELAGFLTDNDGAYHPGSVMSTFVGNHDLPRIVHLAEDTPMYDDWDGGQWNAWENQPGQPDYGAPYERMAVAFALIFTNRGIPLVYYGDEVGLAGAGDPDNRRFMQWDSYSEHQLSLRTAIGKLGEIRAEEVALRRGRRTVLGATSDVLVYEMRHDDELITVALNRGDTVQGAENLPTGSYRDLFGERDVTAPLTLEPRSIAILRRK